mgnify:CR=1 FL=1
METYAFDTSVSIPSMTVNGVMATLIRKRSILLVWTANNGADICQFRYEGVILTAKHHAAFVCGYTAYRILY